MGRLAGSARRPRYARTQRRLERRQRRVRQPAAVDEDEALAALAQDLEVVRLVRMQAQEDQPALRRRARKKSSMKPM